MDRNVAESDFVLIVITKRWHDRCMGNAPPDEGLGVRWESTNIYQHIYEAGSNNAKFVPVLFDKSDKQWIPAPLGGTTHYLYAPQYADLLKRLDGVPPATKAPLGARTKGAPPKSRPALTTRVAHPDFFKAPETNFPDHDIAKNLNFVGREDELARLYDQLSKGNVAITHALSGEGGIGKTQLTVEFAFRHAGDFDGLWWIDASNDGIESSLARLAAKLDPNLPPTAAPDEIRRAISAALSQGKYLLILDNLEDPAKLAGLAITDPSRMLITTRRTDLPAARIRQFPVEVLARDESLKLLALHRPRLLEDVNCRRDLNAVAEHLGDHALALALCGAYLRDYPDVMPAELLTRLKSAGLGDEKSLLDDLDPSRMGTGYRLKVAQSLTLHLPVLENTPAMTLLSIASLCHPDDIPIDLLADAAKVDLDAARKWLRQLADLSILDYHEKVSLHRLTQQAVRSQRDKKTRDGILTSLVDALYKRFADPLDYRNWASQDHYAAHALACIAYGDVGSSVADVGPLANQVGLYLQNRARFDEALAALRAAERINRAAYGDNHPEVATDVNNIGGVLQDRGDLDGAMKCFRETERIDRAAYGDNHPDVAIDVNNIGGVLQDKGDLDGALKCYRAAERIDRAAYGDNHPNVAARVSNIGLVLQDKGDLDGAMRCFREAERINRAAYGDDHPQVATLVNNIGMLLQDKGDLDGAMKCYREAEFIDRAAYGDGHPEVAADVNNIGMLLLDKGDLDGALKCLREAFGIFLTTEGPRSLRTLVCARNFVELEANPIQLAREIAGNDAADQLAAALRDPPAR
jgi:tetratricopeptide (TPR) repeat protein